MGVFVKSGVIITSNSPQVLKLPRNPPKLRLPSVSISSLSIPSIVFDAVPIPVWSSHLSKIYNLFTSSSFNEKGCILPPVDNYNKLCERIQAADISLSSSDYFQYLIRSMTDNSF